MTIGSAEFTVAGFLRDSQMNSAIVSSKRFLVQERDFEKVKDLGKLEYLIEFRLKDLSSVAAFETAYMDAGLEANGPPAIISPFFKLIISITDGSLIGSPWAFP